jgi:hypothetical protein
MAAQIVSSVRAAALRNRCLSLAKTCSIGFKSGEYFGMKLLRYVLLVAALCTATKQVHAEIAVNEMFQRFRSGTKMVQEFYLTMQQGNHNGLEAANFYLASQKAAELFVLRKAKRSPANK